MKLPLAALTIIGLLLPASIAVAETDWSQVDAAIGKKAVVIGSETRRDAIRDQIIELLEAASYPIQDIAENEREDDVEIVATLATSSVTSEQLDAVVESLAALDGVSHATWSSRTSD